MSTCLLIFAKAKEAVAGRVHGEGSLTVHVHCALLRRISLARMYIHYTEMYN